MNTLYTFVPSPEHVFPDHPERPGRLDLLDLASIPGIESLSFSAARVDEVGRVHTAEMIEQLQAACAEGPGIIDYAPTFVTVKSFESALAAAGATLAATRAVLKGEAKNAFAIVRPPGHHAEPERSMGFCLFNNVAIATQDALAHGLERVAVIDFDVHHGNGTQAAFLSDPHSAYLSTHQKLIYPGTGRLEDADEAGKRGRIVNVPLPSRTGDKGFAQILEQVIAPFVRSFQPELLIVSAGYDAYWSDPLATLGLSTAGYFMLSRDLVNLAEENCKGRIAFVLEGGYDATNVANGIRAGFAALTGDAAPEIDDASPHPEPDIAERLERTSKWHGF